MMSPVERQGFTSCFPVASGFVGCLKLRDVEVEDEGKNTMMGNTCQCRMSMPFQTENHPHFRVLISSISSGMVKSHFFSRKVRWNQTHTPPGSDLFCLCIFFSNSFFVATNQQLQVNEPRKERVGLLIAGCVFTDVFCWYCHAEKIRKGFEHPIQSHDCVQYRFEVVSINGWVNRC